MAVTKVPSGPSDVVQTFSKPVVLQTHDKSTNVAGDICFDYERI